MYLRSLYHNQDASLGGFLSTLLLRITQKHCTENHAYDKMTTSFDEPPHVVSETNIFSK